MSTPRGSRRVAERARAREDVGERVPVTSTVSVLRLPGGTETSMYRGSAATPSTGPRLPQNSPQITRTRGAVVVDDLGNVGGLMSW